MTRSKQRRLAWTLSALAAATLAACGGGGGGTAAPGSTTPPATDIPVAVAPPETGAGTGEAPTTPAAPVPSPEETSGSTGGTGNTGSSAGTQTGAAPMLEDCEMFPSNAIFNTRIDDTSRFPKHPSSDRWVAMVGGGVTFTADWGNSSNPANLGDYWGMPINVIAPGATNWPVVSFDFTAAGLGEPSYPFKSDCATSADGASVVQDCTSVPAGSRRFPFPSGQTLNEGGLCGGPASCNNDHHVLVVERGACRLWESFYAHNIGGQWYAVTTAMWNLKSNALRPDNWASADAAGLPITPLLAKASEASAGEIRHALRVTFRDLNIAQEHVWPARHHAGGDNPGAIPFGALLRLKADFVIPDHWSTHAKAIALAAKRYGLYVSDNGMDFYVQGEPNSAWNPALWQELKAITMSHMEFVDLRAVTSDPRWSPDSMAASW